MAGSWTVVLNGVALQSNQNPLPPGVLADQVMGCLSEPPAGMGVPPLRVEDQTFAQRDGVAHFKDWYDARIITLEDVTIDSEEACAECSVRADVRDLMEAWARHCADTELVIFTDCHGTDPDRSLVGPFGVRGRPRVADLTWHTTAGVRAATATLRFDGVDHRLYILDANGTPGSGQECAALPLQEFHEYTETVQDDAPDSYWRMNEPGGSSTANDSGAPPTHNGTFDDAVFGSPPLAPQLQTSVLGSNLDGTGFQADADARTIEMWWKVGVSNSPNIWFSDAIGVPYNLTKFQLEWDNVAHALSAPTLALLDDGNAHHLVVTYSSPDLKFYVDGVLRETFNQVGASLFPNTDSLEFFRSYYSDVAMYDTVLSAARVLAHYEAANEVLVVQSVEVSGNVCVPATITFNGPLTNPSVRTIGGNFLAVNLTLEAGDVVVVDTETGGAALNGNTNVVYVIGGDPFLALMPGTNEIGGVSEDGADTGTIEICWRPAVISG